MLDQAVSEGWTLHSTAWAGASVYLFLERPKALEP
jgi:hypothetical protein